MLTIIEDRLLDARGLSCPMPILKTAKEIRSMDEGQILKVLTTDRGSLTDFPAWAADTGHELLEWHDESGTLVFHLRKKEGES